MQEFKQDTKQIVGYTLGEYTEEVLKAIAEGYTISTENDKYPYHFGGGGYYATFVLVQAIPTAPIATPVNKAKDNPFNEVLDQAKDIDSVVLDNQPETTVKSNRQSRRTK